MAKKLVQDNFRALEAADGREGLDTVAQEIPDLIVLDLMMPAMDGFQVLEALKKNPVTRDVPVVVWSNIGEQDTMAKAKLLGAVDYMVKANLTLEEIVQKISDILSKK